MQSPVAPGDIIDGKFAVQRVLAVGGNGVVVVAKHLTLLEPCAIKLMKREHSLTPLARERFLREARALAKLKSDHVVRVFDVGQLDEETPFIVMEYLEGADLDELLVRRGRLTITEAATYVMQMCAGLAEAHKRGIVHRDLKPANAFVTRTADGLARIKLLDFGISKVLDEGAGPDALTTLEGSMMGTPAFMAPEQISGSAVDARTDVWALGVILYQLVTGALPFTANPSPMLSVAQVLTRAPAPPSQHLPTIPRDLERLILACLEKPPESRPPSVQALAAALAPFAGPEGEPLLGHVRRVLDSDPEPRLSAADIRSPLAASGVPTLSPGDLATPVSAPQSQIPRRSPLLVAALAAIVGIVIAAGVWRWRSTADPLPPLSAAAASATAAAVTATRPTDAPAPQITAASAAPVTPGEPLPSARPVREPPPPSLPSRPASAPTAKPSVPSSGFDLGDRH